MENKKHHARNGVCSKQQQQQQDSSGSNGSVRQVPRNARRRESKASQESSNHHHQLRNNTNSGGGPTSQQQQQQHRNNFDRRAKWNNRNNGGGGRVAAGNEAAGLAEEDADEEDIYLEQAEWDSVLVPGSKKHNLNHLLNFHYAPRDRDLQRPNRGKRDGQQLRGGAAAKNAVAGTFYNKDQFIQANCNFIVKDTGNYKQHAHNPDVLVDWQHIEQVIIRSAEEPQCPICLFPPVAAKMTKCGHVYCWPCILHYLALSDKEWRKCPICYDAVRIKDLRSTVSWPYHEYQMHETVDFQLMCRRKGALEVTKVTSAQQQQDENALGADHEIYSLPHLFDIREQQVCHSKLILANQLEVSSIVDRERCELQAQMRTDGPEGFDCPETMFITQALDLLEERAAAVKFNWGEQVGGGAVDVSQSPPAATTITAEDSAAEDFYYFYQAIDGQHLYMHSINLRMLQAQFGSLAQCPPLVTGRIVQREHFSVSEALRKKSKYLQHLPLTSIITVVEVAFSGGLLTDEVRQQFDEEMAQRKRDRQRRARDEKKRERKINDMQEREMGKMLSQSAGFVREVDDFYPFLTNNDAATEEQDGVAGGGGGGGNTVDGMSNEEAAGSPNKPFSFAKMLQCTSEIEKAQPQFWPTLDNKKPATAAAAPQESSTSSSGWVNLGGQRVRTAAPKMDKHFPNLLDTIDVEDAEDHHHSQADVPVVKSSSSSPKESPVKPPPNGPKGAAAASKRAAKKKPQQLLLFSTDMNFNRS